MIYDLEETLLTRYALSGLLGGLLAIMVNFIFDIFFRTATGFSSFQVINVSTIIFGSIVPVTIGGISFYFFDKIKGGIFLYMLFFLAITILVSLAAAKTQLSNIPAIQLEFHELFVGVIAVIGVFTTFLVPIIVKNEKLTDAII